MGPRAQASPLQRRGNTHDNQILVPNVGPMASGHEHSVISTTISSYDQLLVSLPTHNSISWHQSATWWLTSEVIWKLISFTKSSTEMYIFQVADCPTCDCCHHKLCARVSLCEPPIDEGGPCPNTNGGHQVCCVQVSQCDRRLRANFLWWKTSTWEGLHHL